MFSFEAVQRCPECYLVYTSGVERCGVDGALLEESALDPLIGQKLDRYQILEPIGSGGVAILYRALHLELERQVAIKVLYGEMASRPVVIERFRREARAASQIDHPHVVKTYDFGTTDRGLTYMVMEMLEGVALSWAIAKEAPLPLERIKSLAKQIVLGLQAAHALGFVHRDLKPSNVMLVEGGTHAKVLDFGLVGLIEAPDQSQRLTLDGTLMGTPHYLAPEIICGGEASIRSDLYAVGVTLFEMLTGRPPFDGAIAEVLAYHSMKPAPRLAASGGFEEIVAKLLEKDPDARFESTAALLEALDTVNTDVVAQAALETEVIEAPKITVPLDRPLDRPARRSSRRFWWAFAVPLLVGAVVAVTQSDKLQSESAVSIEAQAAQLPASKPSDQLGSPNEREELRKLKKPGAEGEAVRLERTDSAETTGLKKPGPLKKPGSLEKPGTMEKPRAAKKIKRAKRPIRKKRVSKQVTNTVIEVSIVSEPSGAEVSIQGGLLGITPLTSVLAADRPTVLTLRKSGHKPLIKRYVPKAGPGPAMLRVRLKPIDAR